MKGRTPKQAPTPEYLETCHYRLTRRGNKGYARDHVTGEYLEGDVHMGYHWDYRCEEFPRLVHAHHIMHPSHDRENWSEWHVDGDKCADLAAACAALLLPVQLTLAQYYAWVRLGPDPVEYDQARNVIAGCISDHPNFIHFEERWGKASRLIDELRDKGMVYYENEMLYRRAQ